MNTVQVTGGLVTDAKVIPLRFSTVLSFTVAVGGVRWNRETREDEIVTTFVSVQHYLDGWFSDDDMLYKGDHVHVLGELSQAKREGEKTVHTRVEAITVTVLRRGRDGAQAVSQQHRPSSVPDAPDPWAEAP